MSKEEHGVANGGYRFGQFELQPSERRLLQAGRSIALPARAFDVLIVLVENSQQLVSKETLLSRVWYNLVVEESNLQVQISALRKTLGQDSIATVFGHGYRFTQRAEYFDSRLSAPHRSVALDISKPEAQLISAAELTPRYVAIMVTAIVGLDRLEGHNEALSRQLRVEYKELVEPVVATYRGCEIDSLKSGLSAEFESVAAAVRCAKAIHAASRARNENEQISCRIVINSGIHYGKIDATDHDGRSEIVSIASALGRDCEMGGIYVSGQALRELGSDSGLSITRQGDTPINDVGGEVVTFRVRSSAASDRSIFHDSLNFLKRRIVASFALTGLVAIGVVIVIWQAGHSVPTVVNDNLAAGGLRSLAILPFRRIYPGDSRDEYLGVGLADALIVHLGNLQRLLVRPTSNTLRYDGTTDPLLAGKEQGVDAVLTGTIQHTGDKIRVTAQLIKIADGASIWAGKFDEVPRDLFKLEDSLSEQIAKAMLRSIDDTERKRITKRYTSDTEAYELYLRGKYQWSRFSQEGLDKATEYYTRSIVKDPSFALAYAGLASTYNVRGAMGFATPRDVWSDARKFALKAIELDSTLAEAHVGLAAERLLFAWDLAGGKRELDTAIQLNPNNGEPYSLYSYYFEVHSRFDEAIAMSRQAVMLDPNSALYNADLSSAYYFSGHFDDAITAWNKVIEIDPGFNAMFLVSAQALERLGRHAEAIAECERAIKAGGKQPGFISALAFAYASSGDRVRARALTDELVAQWNRKYFPPTLVAIAFAGLGDKAKAIEWLDRAIESRDPQVLWFAVEPQLNSLHDHQRWRRLIKQVGLLPPTPN